MSTILGTLTPEEYWEWRTTIAEWHKAKQDLMSRQLRLGMMEKDVEIARLKIALNKRDIQDFEGTVTPFKEEYEKTKVRLEKRLGCTLDGCVINDSFEVIKLEDSNESKSGD